MVKIKKCIFPPRRSWKIYKKFFISGCRSCNIETCGGKNYKKYFFLPKE